MIKIKFFILPTSEAEYAVIDKSQLTVVTIEQRFFLWQSFPHSQELENRLRLQDGTLEKISGLAKSIKQNTSSVGQKIIKEDIKSLKCKHRDLENRLESAKQEMGSYLNSVLKAERSSAKREKFPLPGGEAQVASDAREATRDSAAVGKLEEGSEINKVSGRDCISKHRVWEWRGAGIWKEGRESSLLIS